ncbi:MAG: SH3 domain-containing protein [Saprospiraceae bacterium]
MRLRDAPGENAKVILALPKGTILYDLGEVSDFTTKILLRGIEFDDPWLKVRTEDGTEGWVDGGALNFTMDDASKLTNLLINKRLVSLFGQALADSMVAYRQHFNAVKSAADMAQTYREGTALRDAVVGVMDNKITVNDPNELPDLFWLEQAMPGFVTQLVAEGTAYYLFWDYKKILQKVNNTVDTPDNDFVQLAIMLFPEDSVEYFYPAWFLQTWDYGGSSLLGRGVHQQLLQKMDEALQKSDLFAPEIRRWKTLLLNDITQPDVNYWEKQEKILAELDTILVKNYPILTAADKIALQTRRKQFENPSANGISVNQQAGN